MKYKELEVKSSNKNSYRCRWVKGTGLIMQYYYILPNSS